MVRANCERLGDTFTGAALLFCAVAAVVAFGGLWMGEPLFAVSSAFALTAAAAFGIGARTMSQAAKAAPRIWRRARRSPSTTRRIGAAPRERRFGLTEAAREAMPRAVFSLGTRHGQDHEAG